MHISAELMLSIIVQLIATGITLGIYIATIKFMQMQINELKEDMRKYNNLRERMVRVEDSAKSAHLRINDIER